MAAYGYVELVTDGFHASGTEDTTEGDWLRNRCSATELHRRFNMERIRQPIIDPLTLTGRAFLGGYEGPIAATS